MPAIHLSIRIGFSLCLQVRVRLGGERLTVRHEHPVLLVVVAGGEDIGALDRLVEEAEDVKDEDNSLVGIGRTGDI